jgi:hypothetical protein
MRRQGRSRLGPFDDAAGGYTGIYSTVTVRYSS